MDITQKKERCERSTSNKLSKGEGKGRHNGDIKRRSRREFQRSRMSSDDLDIKEIKKQSRRMARNSEERRTPKSQDDAFDLGKSRPRLSAKWKDIIRIKKERVKSRRQESKDPSPVPTISNSYDSMEVVHEFIASNKAEPKDPCLREAQRQSILSKIIFFGSDEDNSAIERPISERDTSDPTRHDSMGVVHEFIVSNKAEPKDPCLREARRQSILSKIIFVGSDEDNSAIERPISERDTSDPTLKGRAPKRGSFMGMVDRIRMVKQSEEPTQDNTEVPQPTQKPRKCGSIIGRIHNLMTSGEQGTRSSTAKSSNRLEQDVSDEGSISSLTNLRPHPNNKDFSSSDASFKAASTSIVALRNSAGARADATGKSSRLSNSVLSSNIMSRNSSKRSKSARPTNLMSRKSINGNQSQNSDVSWRSGISSFSLNLDEKHGDHQKKIASILY